MNFRLWLMILVTALTFGCEKKDSAAPTDTVKKAAPVEDPFLKQVPAETAYFAHAKMEINDAFTQQALAPLESPEFKEELSRMQASQVGQERLIAAYLNGIADRIKKKDLASIGMDKGRLAAYGLGIWPVLSIELSDGKKFETWFKQLETESKFAPKTEDVGGKVYRIYEVDPTMNIVVYIDEKEAKYALVPTELKTEIVAHLVGQKSPAKNIMQADRVSAWRKKHNLSKDAYAYIEFDQLFKIVTQRGSGLNQTLATKEQKEFKVPGLDAVCTSEIDALLQKSPRLLGTTAIAKDLSVDSRLVVEMEDGLAQDLMTLTPKTSAKNNLGSILAFGISVDSGALIELTKKAADAVAKAPFKCKEFGDLNQALAQANAQVMFIPPFARAFRGAQLNLNDIKMKGEMPDVTANLILYVENAPAVFAALKGMVPMLASLPEMTPNGTPVPLEGLPIPPVVASPLVALAPNAIGISVGANGAAALTKAVTDSGLQPTPLVGFQYDFQSVLPLLEQLAAGSQEFKDVVSGIKGTFSSKGVMNWEFTKSGLEMTTQHRPLK